MAEKKMKPIWYFVALNLMIVGGIILFAGIYQFINPPNIIKVLSYTHPNIWWGAIMVIFGAVLFVKTRKMQND